MGRQAVLASCFVEQVDAAAVQAQHLQHLLKRSGQRIRLSQGLVDGGGHGEERSQLTHALLLFAGSLAGNRRGG